MALRTPVILVLTFILVATSHPAAADFRTELARQFNANSNYFVLNLPPRAGGWPGSMYTSDMRLPITFGEPDDPSLSRGPEFDFASNIGFDVSSQVGLGITGLFGLSASASGAALASVTFKKARIYDLTL